MIKISKEDYKLRLTKRDEFNIDKLNDSQLKLYLAMYSLYMEWLLSLLIINTNLKEIDLLLKHSNLKFEKVKEDKVDFYQKFAIEYLDYFYIRNNLYLYRLNNQEYNFMIERIKKDNYALDKETEKFILSTYKKVIYEKVDGFENIKVNHDVYNTGRFIYNNSIIIGFRYNEYNDLEDKIWYENLKKQEKFLDKQTDILIKNIHDYFNWTVTLLKYR